MWWQGGHRRKQCKAAESSITSCVGSVRSKGPSVNISSNWKFVPVEFWMEMHTFRIKANSRKHALPVLFRGCYIKAESVYLRSRCNDVGVMKQKLELKTHTYVFPVDSNKCFFVFVFICLSELLPCPQRWIQRLQEHLHMIKQSSPETKHYLLILKGVTLKV